MQILMNATPLLARLTGIGYYTYHLSRALEKLEGVHMAYFMGGRWKTQLHEPGAPDAVSPPSRLAGAYRLANKFVPGTHLLRREFEKLTFRRRPAAAHGTPIYHEPCFLPLPFDGATVITVHDLSCFRHPETHPAARVRRMEKELPRAIEKASQIIADSEFSRDEICKYFGTPADKVNVTLLGVSPQFHPRPPEPLQNALAHWGLQAGHYILYVGTLEPRKNLKTLIAAFSTLPPAIRSRIPLVIAGGRGWHHGSLEKQMQDLLSRGELRVLGYVDDAHLPFLYSGARVFVFPSLYEGFGMPPLEAMACGTPVIVSDTSSLPEVVGECGMQVPPLDTAALGAALLQVIEDSALAGRLAEAGRQRAAGFTWTRCAQETLAIYRKALPV